MEGSIRIGVRASIIKVYRTVVITMMKILNQSHSAANVEVVKLVTVSYKKIETKTVAWKKFKPSKEMR